MKRVFYLLIFATFIPLVTHAQQPAQYRFTLDDCLDYAMGNSYTRQSMELSQRAAELDQRQSRLERLPSLNGSASENLSHQSGKHRTIGGSYGVNASMTVFQAGTLNEQIKQDDILVNQAGARTAQWDNSLAISILGSYFAILGYEELQRYQGSLIEVGRQQVHDGKAQVEAGTILPSDYLMINAQLAQNVNNAAQTEIDMRDELRNLKGLMSMPLDADLVLSDPDTTMVVLPAEQLFVERAEAVMPDLELLDYGVQIAQSSLRISKAGYFPSVSLSGGVSTGHSNDFRNWGAQVEDRLSQSAGLSLSVPIFNRGRVRTGVQRSKIALQQAELERLQGESDVRESLLLSYSNAVAAQNDYQTALIREDAYRQSLDAARAQYAARALKPVDLLQQENNYINVLYNLIQSKYSFLLRRRILDVYMGEE